MMIRVLVYYCNNDVITFRFNGEVGDVVVGRINEVTLSLHVLYCGLAFL